MKLLIVEDDHDLAASLQESLVPQYACDVCYGGVEARRLAAAQAYDLMLLDIDLPDMSGLEVCRQLRAQGATLPILFLTGKFNSLDDKISGLDVGADDYLIKPVDAAELLARIRARLRRGQEAFREDDVSFADVRLSLVARTVRRGDQVIILRRKEFDLLEYLLRNHQRVVTRDMILQHVWGSEVDMFTNAVDVHIKYLRDKIDKPFPRKLIKTVHGVGYKIE